MQTQVYVGEMRPSYPCELWSAVSKRPHCWVGEVTIVSEPLEATHSRGGDGCFSGNHREAIAIGTRTTRKRPGLVSGSVNGLGEARVEGENWANRPASGSFIEHFVHVIAQGFAAADGQLINGIG